MSCDFEFDTNAVLYGPEAWAAEVACYKNALEIMNLEARAIQAKDPEEFEAVFSLLAEAQKERRELGRQKCLTRYGIDIKGA